jgi:hypothetical protein
MDGSLALRYIIDSEEDGGVSTIAAVVRRYLINVMYLLR